MFAASHGFGFPQHQSRLRAEYERGYRDGYRVGGAL